MTKNESFIWGLIRNIRERREKKRMLKNISIQNENNKQITRYRPSQIEAFFSPTEPAGNIVVSGENVLLRNRAIIGALDSVVNQGISVVVLHAGNQMLESMLLQHCQNITVFNRGNALYEPFVGLSNLEICRMIQNSATKISEIHSGGQYYLEGMSEFIRSKNIPPYCEMYITCPHLELFDKIDEAEMNGKINSALSQRIKTMIAQGQTWRSEIENYFNLLRHQAQGLLANKYNINKATSLRSIVNHNGVAVLDIGSNTNDLLLNLTLCDLTSALNNGHKVFLVVDELSVSASEQLERIVKNSGVAIYLLLSSSDIYASLNANDNLFASMVGKATKNVIFRHASGLTCIKWSEVIGYYEKKEVTNTYTSGQNYHSMFSITPGQTNTDSINVNLKREYIVKAEEISHMDKDEVYIIDMINNELINARII